MSRRKRKSETCQNDINQSLQMKTILPPVTGESDEKKKLKAKRKADDGWGGREGYWHEKALKLDRQFENQVICSEGNRSEIFKGVVIFINGYTKPSPDQLRKLMKENGGKYQQYYSMALCTHIIATNLPDNKIKDIRNKKVVHPDWITDSVQAKRKLPLYNYLLYGGAQDSSSKLNFRKNPDRNEKNTEVKTFSGSSTDQIIAKADVDIEQPLSVKYDYNKEEREEETLPNDDDDQREREFDFASDRNSKIDLQSPLQLRDASYLGTLPKIGIENVDHDVSEGSIIAAPNLSKHIYTTAPQKGPGKAGDANFISDFYSNSRLHHLSMWRSELKRFAKMIHQNGRKTKGKRKHNYMQTERIIMHIDLDSFFVSVALKECPQLRGKPIAVCHAGRGDPQKSDDTNFNSMSEIASCSYEARKKGVKNGMFLGNARKICTNLQCVPYYFENYKAVSQTFYEILASYTSEIEAVSCDEALLDISDLVTLKTGALDLASRMREEIEKKTGCTASCGIGPNILLAKMATRNAKPNGQIQLNMADVQNFMLAQKVRDLPGVGWSLGHKFDSLNIITCGDLQKLKLNYLQIEFGKKNGLRLFNHCRGEDSRPLRTEQERKSVSAEINYGIRFLKESEAEDFITDLAEEVQKRLDEIEMKGFNITLKLMVKKGDAPNPAKFMGHGFCDNLSRSSTLNSATSDRKVIAKECISLVGNLKIPPQDFRGIGIQVSKLIDASSGTAKSETTLDRFIRGQVENETTQKKVSELLVSDVNEMNQDTKDHSNLEIENCCSTFDKVVGMLKCPNEADNVAENIVCSSNVSLSKSECLPSFFDGPSEGKMQNTIFKEPVLKFNRKKNSPDKNGCKKLSPRKKSPRKKSPKKTSPSKKNPVSNDRFFKMTDFVTRTKLSSESVVSPTKYATEDPPLPFLPASPSLIGTEKKPVKRALIPAVNMDVLNELPRDVRETVMKEYNLNEFILPKIDVSPQKKTNDTGQPNVRPITPEKTPLERKSYIDTRHVTPVHQSLDPVHKQSKKDNYYLSPSQVDQSVLSALPLTIQNEIKEVLQVRTAGRCQEVTPHKERSQQTDKAELGAHKSVADENVTPQRKLLADNRIDLLSPSQIDLSVLEHLPSEIRTEIQFALSKNSHKHRKEISKQIDLPPNVNIIPNDGVAGRLDQSLFSPSQIVPDVLEALPCEIQQEINLGLRMKALRKDREKKRKEFAYVQNQILDKKIEEQMKADQPQTLNMVTPSLGGFVEYSDVKNLIRQWIDSSQEVLQEDIDCLIDYFRELVGKHDLETAFLLLKYLRRFTLKSGETWREVYKIICSNIQSLVQEKYGSRLLV